MGLAASQARYLALTARKSDLEFQSQTINTRRIQLAYKTAEIAQAYSEGMNNQRIKMSTKNSQGTPVWEAVTFGDLLKEGYIVIPVAGEAWSTSGTDANSCPYSMSGSPAITYTRVLTNEAKLDEEIVISGLNSNSPEMTYLTPVSGKTNTYKLKATAALIANVNDTTWGTFSDTFKSLYTVTTQKDYSSRLNVNSNYNEQKGGADIQSLLTSGNAQIVTKEFYNYLCQRGFDPFAGQPITAAAFAHYQEEFDNGDCIVNHNKKSICDWRADETETFAQRNFTEDDAQVLAKYEADTAEIQRQDKVLEMQEKNIETQHKAIETELESISKVIQKNIETTFKIFS